MPALPKQISDFMAAYGVDADEIWLVHGGSNWVVKHKALERVAVEKGIIFDPPTIIEKDAANNTAVICVTGRMGDRLEWSIGEASPANYRVSGKQPGYPYAMAEKRAKDRVILKLLNTHGVIYSEEEADDFKSEKRQNPHVTRPADIVPDVEYDQHGQPVDNIPLGDERIERMTKTQSKPEFAALQLELYAKNNEPDLMVWGATVANRVATMHTEYQEIFRGLFKEHRETLRQGKAA